MDRFNETPISTKSPQEEINTRNLATAYARLFNTEDGKLVLEDLKHESGLEAPIFSLNVKGEYSHDEALLIEGQRQFFLGILKAIEKGNELTQKL